MTPQHKRYRAYVGLQMNPVRLGKSLQVNFHYMVHYVTMNKHLQDAYHGDKYVYRCSKYITDDEQ